MTNPSSASDLNSFLKLLWRRRLVVAGTTLAALALVLVLDLAIREQQYESKAEILVTNSTSELISGESSSDLDRIMRNELVIAESRAVRVPIEQKYGRDFDVQIEITEGQDILEVVAVDSNAASAAQLASDYAASYLGARESAAIDEFVRVGQVVRGQIEDLDAQIEDLPTASGERSLLESQRVLLVQRLNELTLSSDLIEGGSARIVSEPFAADTPTSPSPVRDAVLAIALGLMLGTGLAYLWELVDRLSDDDGGQIADSLRGLSVLVELPRLKHDPALAILDDRAPTFNEAVRRLATSVGFALQVRGSQVVQVVAAVSGEGKSTVAANLALALAERRNRVLLVDGDLRSPGLTQLFGIDPDRFRGLADLVLEEPTQRTYSVAGLVHKRSELLSVLPAGIQRADAIVGLGSDRLEPLYAEIAKDFEYVIVDSSPLLAVTDGALLARHADLRLMVVGTNTTASTIFNTRALLEHLGLGIGGVVLNRRIDQSLQQYGSGSPRGMASDRVPAPDGRRATDGMGRQIPVVGSAELVGNAIGGLVNGNGGQMGDVGDPIAVDAIAHLLDELAPTLAENDASPPPPVADVETTVTSSLPIVKAPETEVVDLSGPGGVAAGAQTQASATSSTAATQAASSDAGGSSGDQPGSDGSNS